VSTELPAELQIRDHPRRFKLHAAQWVGIPLIFVVPILALLGVFGESREVVVGQSDELGITVEYPTRYRYKQIDRVQVLVENESNMALDTVVVAFDPAYVSRFSTLMFIPSAREPFDVELLDVRAGETRRVWAELQGEAYGLHRGTIEAYTPGSRDTASVFVSTIIFP
jgi:hypothetical protein